MVDRARRALAAHDPAAALALLDERATFASRLLSPEADVLRIDALTELGQISLAGQLARKFLTAHPKSPHAARVRAWLEAHSGSAKP